MPTTACPSCAAAPVRIPAIPPRAAFLLKASITLTFLAGSSAPTPLYALYQAHWGFSSTMLTVIFGVYALAVLAALLVVGRLSDHVGRRPVLMTAAAMQAVTMLLFASADGVGDLLFARVLQGLSAGAALAAVGAGLLDLDRQRGTIANAVAPMTGTAIGGVLAGLMVQYLPAPTHLVYLALGAVFVLQGIGVWFIAETAVPRPGALASLRPILAVPAAVRGAMWVAVPALVAVWAIGGFYASLAPKLLHGLFGSDSTVLGGGALFALAGSGALAVLAMHRLPAATLTRIGMASLAIGLAIVLLSLPFHALPLFLVGTLLAGVGFGTGFQGGLRSVLEFVDAGQRAAVLSVLFVVSYLAMGGPAIVAGWRLVQSGDLLETAREFGAVVITLALLALAGTWRRRA